MRNMVMSAAVVLLVGAFGMPKAVRAATVSIAGHSPQQVKNSCAGGNFFAPGANGVYGCLAGDGSGIVCGGVGKYKKTCSTWGPDTRILPTQAQVQAAEAKQATQAKQKSGK